MKHHLIGALLVLSSHALPAAIPGAEMLARLISTEFDLNSDDLVDQSEWKAGIANGFDKLDSNGDRSIKPDEAGELQGEIAEESGDLAAGLVVVLIQQALLSLDTDGDKAVSRKEYDALSDGIFARLDADKNNSLTLAEVSELPGKLVTK